MYRRRAFTLEEAQAADDIRVKLSDAERMICRIRSSRERSLALTKLDEAMLWANVAIAEVGMEDIHK